MGLGSDDELFGRPYPAGNQRPGSVSCETSPILLWALDVGVHADAPAHSFPTNADARGEAVRTMPRTLACCPLYCGVQGRHQGHSLVLRCPSYAAEPYNVRGAAAATVARGSYSAPITAAWADGNALSYAVPLALRSHKCPDSEVVQICDTSFSRQPTGEFFTLYAPGGCVTPPLWPFVPACVFYRDFSAGTAHFVPTDGSQGEEDCVPPTARYGLVTLPAATAANLTRGVNFSCTWRRTCWFLCTGLGGRADGNCWAVGTYRRSSSARPSVRRAQIAPGSLTSTAARLRRSALTGCHNWMKQAPCLIDGAGGGCSSYVSGGARHTLNCSGANQTYQVGTCAAGPSAAWPAVVPCTAATKAPAVDLTTSFIPGPEFNSSMLGAAKNIPRYALLYGPLLLAATGPWDPLLNVVRMPAGLDPTRPADWLAPILGKPGGYFHVVASPEYTFEPYMLVQAERFTTYPIFPTALA